MSKQSAEDYLDKLLNSVNADEEFLEEEFSQEGLLDTNTEGALEEAPDFHTEKMVSKRVSKAEEDFLREFEAELEEDSFEDFLKDFDEDMDVPFDVEDVQLSGGFKTEEVPDPFASIPGMDEAMEPSLQEEMESMNMADLFAEAHPETNMDNFAMNEMAMNEMAIQEMPMNEMAMDEMAMDEMPVDKSGDFSDSFSLGGVDLGSLFEDEDMGFEAVPKESVMPSEEPSAPASQQVMMDPFGDPIEGDMPDPFANLFGEASGEGDSGVIDLGNMGEEDLMSLLSGDGFGDIGDMLTQNDSGEVSMDTMDAFAAFAEVEMAPAASDAEEAPKAKKKLKLPKGKSGGFLEKLSLLLFGADEEEETVELSNKKAPSAGELSDENAAILASMEQEDAGGKKGKKEKKKKKEKEPKPKKEKKPKAPKVKKEKKPKEKKPKEIDNTPPLKKGPVFLIILMVASLFGLVILGTNLVGYASAVAKSKSFYQNGKYSEAYQELFGLELRQDDMELYNQVATLATADSELNAYEVFYANGRMEEAIDSLICAAGRCRLNDGNAEVYGCTAQMETLRKEVSNELLEKFGMTYEEAIALYTIKDRDDYTFALKAKLAELGIAQD